VSGGFGIAAFALISHIAVTKREWGHSNPQGMLCLGKAEGKMGGHRDLLPHGG
jgi:hypothetical protein